MLRLEFTYDDDMGTIITKRAKHETNFVRRYLFFKYIFTITLQNLSTRIFVFFFVFCLINYKNSVFHWRTPDRTQVLII